MSDLSNLRIIQAFQAVVLWWPPPPDDCRSERIVGYYLSPSQARKEADKAVAQLGRAQDVDLEVYPVMLLMFNGNWHRVILDDAISESDVHL